MGEVTVLKEADLPAAASDLSAAELEALNKFIGQGSNEPQGNMLPRLSINYDAEYVDEDNAEAEPISLKRGHYKITVPVEVDDVKKYVTGYAKTANFNPMYQTYQYSAYNSETESYVLNTTQFKDWGDVVLDDMGGEFKASQYKKKSTALYTDLGGAVKCIRTMYGTVSMDAKDMHGNDVEVADVPCMWVSKGASFMPVADIVDAIKKRGSSLVYHTLVLNTKREKNGGTTYFVVVPDIAKEVVTVNKATLELVNAFAETVHEENNQVITKYKKARKNAKDDDIAKEFSGDALTDDFNDDLKDI